MAKPKIAILMDENTSTGATRYEAAKGFFRAVAEAGGVPFGIPYQVEAIAPVAEDFDALVTAGGRFSYPDDWYIGTLASKAPQSDRFEIEKALVSEYLARDKPILGMCAGMQMLACLQGCRMTPDLTETFETTLEHDRRGARHVISIAEGSHLARAVGGSSLEVNSFHREAIAELAGDVTVTATASDGVIEAIELPAQRFVLGLQWHQEHFVGEAHAGNGVFRALIEAC